MAGMPVLMVTSADEPRVVSRLLLFSAASDRPRIVAVPAEDAIDRLFVPTRDTVSSWVSAVDVRTLPEMYGSWSPMSTPVACSEDT